MSTDRELLELAAKAAGVEKKAPFGGMPYFIRPGCEFQEWRPLTDDGDALRLAVKLGLCVSLYDSEVRVYEAPDFFIDYFENHEEAYAATRRAITRAAAEIGRAMP